MTIWSSQVVPEVVLTTTSGATSDNTVGVMRAPGHQLYRYPKNSIAQHIGWNILMTG